MVTQMCFKKYIFYDISDYYSEDFSEGLTDFLLSVVESTHLRGNIWRKLVTQLEV